MEENKPLYAVHHLNDYAAKANAAAYQVHKLLSEPKLSGNKAFMKGLEGGVQVCKFLSDSLGAALAKPVQFNQLGLIAMLKPVRQDLEKLEGDGLCRLKEQADNVLTALTEILNAVEKNQETPKEKVKEVQCFFGKVREPFLKAATSLLLHERSY